MNFNKKTDLFRFNLDNDSRVKKVNAERKENSNDVVAPEKRGETKITEINVKSLMSPSESEQAPKTRASAPAVTNDNNAWENNTNVINFIRETLTSAGIEATNELVNTIFLKIVEEINNGNFQDVANIKMVSTLIDISLESETDESAISITQLIDALLNVQDEPRETAGTTVGEVRNFILQTAEEVNSQTPPPVVPDVTDEPVVINTPEDAINVITEKIITADFDENTTINDFLLTLQTETSKYIQLQFSYDAGFSDMLAAFMAKVTSDMCGVESGLMKDADLNALKDKFLAFIQDMSFLDTTTDVEGWLTDKYGPYKGRVDWIKAELSEDGYIIRGTIWYGDNSELSYTYSGKPNHALLIKFMMNYFRDTIYFGTLTETQLQYVIQKALEDFGQGCHIPMSSEGKLNLWGNKIDLDKNYNNTFFDDLFASMMRVCEDLKPIDVTKADSIDLDALFGTQNNLSAADIHANEAEYLSSNDPGIRAIFGSLVNVSNQYNITTDVDYLDFLNVFIRMFNEMCGVPNTNPPTLSRATLENYLKQPGAVQELRNFVMSTELRNAYYMETFVINEEIEDFSQDQYTGDCWLLAELITLKQTEAGRKLIADAIDSYVGEDGQTYYTVTFNGGYINGRPKQTTTTYTFSAADIFEAASSGNYSLGQDWDTRLIELAVSKIREEQYFSYYPLYGTDGDPYLYGGHSGELIYYLTGYGNYMGNNSEKDPIITYPGSLVRYEQTEYGPSPYYVSLTRDDLKNLILESLADGTMQSGIIPEGYAYDMVNNGHAYGIVGFTTEGIYYVNPGNTTETLFISWDEYINSSINISTIRLIID